MTVAALAALLLLAQADAPAMDADAAAEEAPPTTPEAAKARALRKLGRCGIQAGQLQAEYQEDTGDYYVTIVTPAAEIAASTYVCLARAEAEDGAEVSFEDSAATQRFWRSHVSASPENLKE